jgi:hypothetical protein
MQIVNGRWVDTNENPIDDFNFHELQKIRESLSTFYGSNINYDKINLLSFLLRESGNEGKLCTVLNNKKILKGL